jgi:hypothetical protein
VGRPTAGTQRLERLDDLARAEREGLGHSSDTT